MSAALLMKFLVRFACSAFLFAMLTSAAHAVIVRGKVTDALGQPVPRAHVQLISHGKVVAVAFSDDAGAFEIRYADGGRFTLLTSASGLFPAEGNDFYGGGFDIVAQDVVMNGTTLKQQVTVTATGIATPLAQLTAPVSVIPQEDFATRIGVVEEMRQTPGTFLVETGQTGSVTSLFVRGGPSDGNKVLIDGIPAEDVGGSFDFGTVSSTGIGGLELYRGPNSALYGSNSQASVVNIVTPHGYTPRPLFTYSGDAGNLHTWRDEATIGGGNGKLDYFTGYSRFDTSNALQYDEYHSSTGVADIGYNVYEGTQLRFTIRDGVSAEGLPNAHDFYGLSQDGKESDQDLYSGVTLENRTKYDWHNLLRYTIARKREQAAYFGQQGTLTTINDPVFGPFQAYVGNVVTIRGANGYTATGQAQLYSTNRDQDSNRDELYYQSDYVFPKNITALFGFRYENERGSFNTAGAFGVHEETQRTNFEYNAQVQGDIKNRFFYSLGGSVQKNHLFGIAGTPRIGLAYVPVRPSARLLHGTQMHINLSTGVQEPSLADEYYSLYNQLEQQMDPQDIALFGITPLGPERSRSADIGVDQNILGEKLVLKANYFHNQFSHQLEDVYSADLSTYFGFVPQNPNVFLYDAEVNSLAYRAQGLETEVEWQARTNLTVRGGYTYLASLVSQSFANDATAVRKGTPTENPNIPGVAIGGISPLVGARPFRRPPNTGFVSVVYSHRKFSADVKSAFAGKSDDSTFLSGSDTTDGNTLLLPNRNLDFGYAKIDLGATYALPHRITVFAQVDNLLNDQHIGPIGYPGLPLTFRSGLKVKLFGGE